jgi:hypothetical protein
MANEETGPDKGTPREQIGQLAQGWADLAQQIEIIRQTKEQQAAMQASVDEAVRLLDEQRAEVEALAAALSLPIWQQLLDANLLEKLRALTTPLAPSPAAILTRLVDDEIARRAQIRQPLKKQRR